MPRNTITGKDYRYDKPLQRAKAIRENCIECMGGRETPGVNRRVRECHITDCHLWPWRSGKKAD